jgi:indole-3-glycerol phosphate synthase
VTGFLDTMVARRTAHIAAEWGELAPADRERLACCARAPRAFAAALSHRADVAVIAEIKKASPSAGPIALQCEASKQALHYEDGGAAAISVLTEPEVFAGSFADLSDVADAVEVPVLCKDFVVDPVQLFVARGHGADAVLLMVSVLGHRVTDYLDLASTLGLECLIEVIDEAELDLALGAGATLIGVNSRDLRTLELDAERAHKVVALSAGAGATTVAASGVKTRDDVRAAASAGADAVLVGETLMRAAFPEDVLAELTGVATGAVIRGKRV